MDVSTSTLVWAVLGAALIFLALGPTTVVWLFIYLIAFIVGVLVMLFHHGRQKSEAWLRQSESMRMPPPAIGIPQIVEDVRKGRPKLRMDRRMTGSSIIDEVLQEIVEYTYRDYVHTWYRKISEDEEFKHEVRSTLQKVIIALSERAKEVDLGPYLTTRLVDDFASHIKLYKQADTKVREHKKDDTKPPVDLEQVFFDLETEMENNMCRDQICLSDEAEQQYLRDLAEVLMFLLLPQEDFHNKPFRFITREVLVHGVFLPSINMFSDPDYINQMVSWLCKEGTFNPESFLTIIKTTDCVEELNAVREKVDLDITIQRSKDTGGDDDTVIKQQLGSLMYVKNLCETRAQRLTDGEDDTDLMLPGGMDINKYMVPGQKLYSLPFDVVLNNNVALSYFIEFMTSTGCQHYLFFYLTVEGYRVSAEQQISACFENPKEKPDLEMLRDAAISIFNQYLSEKASPRLQIEDRVIQLLWSKIQNQSPSEAVFDIVQTKVLSLLQYDERFYPAFKKSQLYIKLLAELDLLKETTPGKSDDGFLDEDDGISSKTSSLQASAEDLASSCDSLSSSEATPQRAHVGNFTFSAQITNTGICREHGKAYATYMINCVKHYSDGSEDTWDVYRRYSDFHDLHITIQSQYDSLSGLALPSKRAFNNMNKDFLEKRRLGLNAYLQTLLNPNLLNSHKGLVELVYQFLENMVWEKEKNQIMKKMTTVVNPLKNSVKNVGNFMKSMPDNFADGVAKMSGGIRSIPNNMLDGVGRMLNVKGYSSAAMITRSEQRIQQFCGAPPVGSPPAIKGNFMDSGKVGASLDIDGDEDNIPVRIVLLLMDEVFDLKSRNQWLRSRIVAILRQIVKTMFGDSINRKIVEHVAWMTSADQIAEYLRHVRDNFWPNGTIAEPRPTRDDSTKMRTRVVCKAKMLATISDEVQGILGSETTRKGVMRVFHMFQHQRLNRRLAYVILEGMLQTLFPDNRFPELFRKIHSRSPRVKTGGESAKAGSASTCSSRKDRSASSTPERTVPRKRK